MDTVIKDFLNERKETWLRGRLKKSTGDEEKEKLEQQANKEFLLEVWLPDAAKRAKQLFSVSHPGKFSHPGARISSVIATRKHSNDGYIRSGNVVVDLDFFGNAAAMDVYKFLSLRLADNKTILMNLENNTLEVKEQLDVSTVPFDKIRQDLLAVKEDDCSQVKTSTKVKQIYFPVENGYHLLSLLTPSGILFKFKERINILRFSEDAKQAREAKKKNHYHKNGFSDIYGLCAIGYGGTKPQNISVFNSQNGGTAYLLQSLPPELSSRTIYPPKSDFFTNILWVNNFKDDFEKLHKLFIGDINNIHTRNKRDWLTKNVIYQVTDRLWMIRYLDAGWSESEVYQQLPQHQKIWLDQKYLSLRDKNIDWLVSVKHDFARWFINTYIKILGKKGLNLGDEQLPYFKSILSECEEALR